ncbi:MAG: PhnD/SsuA/transferrin family substrate-binding protein [Gammaproteobacteria bacterium]
MGIRIRQLTQRHQSGHRSVPVLRPVSICLLMLVLVATSTARAAGSLPRYLRFGVLPLQSPTKLAAMFMPLAENLQQAVNMPVQFVTAPSFSRYMQRVKQREYDIIYLNPLTYTEARKAGYRVIVKVAQLPFTGILVVRKDGPIKSLRPEQLHPGLRLGFPDPNAFAATVMTREYMERFTPAWWILLVPGVRPYAPCPNTCAGNCASLPRRHRNRRCRLP